MLRRRKKLVFALLTVLLATVAIEIVLRCCCFFSPRIAAILLSPAGKISPVVSDPQLGHRPNPAYPGHDRNGFRNPGVPVRADVVVLGDSQTYGMGVEARDAWPRQLERLAGRRVYNMAYGGWGPTHSLLLWDEAMRMKPVVVLEAFYAGNDSCDCFDHVWNKGQLRCLMTADADALSAIRRAEACEPITQRVSRIYRMGAAPSVENVAATAGVGRARLPRITAWLSTHSRVWGLLRRVRHELTAPRRSNASPNGRAAWMDAVAFASRHPAYCEVFTSGCCRTIVTPEYRLTAVDVDDPRIREGQRIALAAIQEMHRRTTEQGVRFVVLLLPIKELVFWPVATNHFSANYERLIRNELQFWDETKAFLAERSIEYLDLLEPLRRQLAAGHQPYPVTRDGHPNAAGHRAIAEAVHEYLSRGKGESSRARSGRTAAGAASRREMAAALDVASAGLRSVRG